MASYMTCRFCGESAREGMTQYGVRHYAHFSCYLEAGKKLEDLHAWQIGQFPFRLLQEHGIMADAEKLIAIERARA